MSALKTQHTLAEIERKMSMLAPYRPSALFNEFLVQGYRAITLSAVPEARFYDLLRAKLCLGTLITLYDDLADRPTQSNPKLLEDLYRLKFTEIELESKSDFRFHPALCFANSLFGQMRDTLEQLPHFNRLSPILEFDRMQFYSANQFSSLVTANPFINNALENRLYAHHNMGMVMVAMMDLMAMETIDFTQCGAAREVFLLGQRMGRIFNVLATRKREAADGDVTGELATCNGIQEREFSERKLRQEINTLYEKILGFDSTVTMFSVKSYLEGLLQVQTIHQRMEGIL